MECPPREDEVVSTKARDAITPFHTTEQELEQHRAGGRVASNGDPERELLCFNYMPRLRSRSCSPSIGEKERVRE
jgi:hypothetical protein